MFRLPFHPVTLLLAGCCLLSGCGVQETAPRLTDADDMPFVPVKAESDQMVEELLPPRHELDLPSPDRVNPFEQTASTAATASSTSLRPQLKGFVEREQTQAVLTLGRRIAVVAEGESFEDVTIIEIKPPRVVYRQRGIDHQLSL